MPKTLKKAVPRARVRAERPRLMLVEDDADFTSILRGWLAPLYDTISLRDGGEALEEAAVCRPDLVILDVTLPGPDGFAVCRKLRRDPRFASTPVLFLTGVISNGAFLKHLESGGTEYLTKPVDRRSLLAAVARLLEGAG